MENHLIKNFFDIPILVLYFRDISHFSRAFLRKQSTGSLLIAKKRPKKIVVSALTHFECLHLRLQAMSNSFNFSFQVFFSVISKIWCFLYLHCFTETQNQFFAILICDALFRTSVCRCKYTAAWLS